MKYIDKLNAALDNPSTSFWLAKALRELETRDPLDALNDVEQLSKLVDDRWLENVREPK